MQKTVYFPIFLTVILFLLIGCSSKLPLPEEQAQGMAAIPISVKNSTSQQRMSFRYKLKQEDETASQIAIDPVVGQNFVIVDNLEAGTYNFSIGRSIYWKVKGIADRNAEDFELDTPFTLYIRPGEVFIPNVKIEIDKYNAGEHKYTTRFSTVELPPEGRDEYLAKLKSTENSNMWQLVTEE